MNHIAKKQRAPEKWQKGELKRLYKGKREKGKCSNERGITLSSTFGKVYEGRATVDHILIMKEVINYLKNKKKSIYVAFLDVTKAYDKAWLDAIMYVVYKQGIQDNNWRIVKTSMKI